MSIRDLFQIVASIARCGLARKFSLRIVGISLFVAVMISAAYSYKNYVDSLERMKKELDQIEHSIQSSLRLHLWQLNLDALNIILDDLLLDKDIVYAKIVDDQGNLLLEKGIKPGENAINRRLPIYYQQESDGSVIYLGELDYVATTKPLYANLRRSILRSSVAVVVFFVILAFIILFVYWESTVRYLLVIKEYANRIRLGGYRRSIGKLELNRHRSANDDRHDELDDLADAINDMYMEVNRKYKAIEYQSRHDALTGLPNRRLINDLIWRSINQCKKVGGYGALLCMDLDHFKLLNESMGHTVGDAVIVELGRRLKKLCNGVCEIARISGDEFLILQDRVVTNKDKAREMAEALGFHILSLISQPIEIEEQTFRCTACVGISVFGPESTVDVAVKQSDNALHHAKSKGPGHMAVFEPAMQKTIDRRVQLEQLLDQAIEKELVYLCYQPKYNNDRKICSVEALVRMRDFDGHPISPGEFIPILEETGQIVLMGDYIINKVFSFVSQNRRLIKASGIESVAINVSPVQFASEEFAERVKAMARSHDIDPDMIVFEITEEVVASDIDYVIDVMRQLTWNGFKISIDDFGSGYSSLKYLKNLPLHELKIDMSFVADLTKDDRARAIVKTIIDMARNLDLDVVAEGVENEAQLKILMEYQCDMYQGFLFSKPLGELDFLKLVKALRTQAV